MVGILKPGEHCTVVLKWCYSVSVYVDIDNDDDETDDDNTNDDDDTHDKTIDGRDLISIPVLPFSFHLAVVVCDPRLVGHKTFVIHLMNLQIMFMMRSLISTTVANS